MLGEEIRKTYGKANVDEFKADDALLSQYIAKCKNGELHKEDINCINANKAKNSIILENSIKKLKG